MHLLLLSLGIGAVPDFVSANVKRPTGEVLVGYLNDAARPYAGEAFVAAEREQLTNLGYTLTDITAGDYDQVDEFVAALDDLDVLYVAGGNTFVLLAALRRHGADAVVVEKVRAGLPYIGSSAGSVITGPSIEPVSFMDNLADAPDLADRSGLRLIDTVVIPHADGALPPYPPELIAQIKESYEADYPLSFVNDDQAILVENMSPRLVSSPRPVAPAETPLVG
ncbi:peptidase S51 dipeptidase E [Rhodococcus sp. SRB_17]|nr:peptidase S51 dipeptidase E [Rhodococcus sp. SRB_17]